MLKRRNIFLCGPSGSGKSTLAAELCKVSEYRRAESPTRQLYNLRGFDQQQGTGDMDEADLFDFQLTISHYYAARTELDVRYATRPLIFDRSPLDYQAYCYAALPDKQDDRLVRLSINASSLGITYPTAAQTLVWLPPAPKDWLLNDGFRKRTELDTVADARLAELVAAFRLQAEPEGRFLDLTSVFELDDRVRLLQEFAANL